MIFKTIETPLWSGKEQNSLTGPVMTGSFEKRAPEITLSGSVVKRFD